MKKWIAILLLWSCTADVAKPLPLPYVKVASSTLENVPIYFQYVGHIEPNLQVQIKSQVDGILEQKHFTEGSQVLQGDLLLTLDSRPFLAKLQQLEAELLQNKAQQEQAEQTLFRYESLKQLNYISSLDYEGLKTNVLIAKAATKQLEAAIESAKLNLSYCKIYAPFDAIASQLYFDPGSYITAGGDHPLMTINQMTPVRLSFYIPENDLPIIASLQQKGPLTVQARLDKQWISGSLFLIDNQINTSTGTILLQAIFDNHNQQLWPGMFTDVRIILQVQENAITVPSSAVSIGQKGAYLYVLNDDQTVDMRLVTLGQDDKNRVIIEKGISFAERIVIEGQVNLKPGIKVQVKR